MAHHGHSRLIDFRRGHARYVPTGRLAVGGMAEVWRGEAHFPDGHVESVAIKRVAPQLAKDPLYHRMLEDEARIGMLLRHPNIVRVYDAREVRGTYILVMELVDGASLREINGRLQQRGAHMPIAAALHVMREVLRALEHAHGAIDDLGRPLELVHRDVSPHNVLIDVHGRVKLMDFGLANSSANLTDRDPEMIGGKFGYLSPELILKQESTHLLDLFAVGVMLWESVTGKRLFQGAGDDETIRRVARCAVPAASSINPQVSPELDDVLFNLLARDPSARYQSAAEAGADLEYLLAQQAEDNGAEEACWLVRLYQSSKTRTSPQSSPSEETNTNVLRPSAPSVQKQTASASMKRMPRMSDSFLDELDQMIAAAQRADEG